MSFNGSQDAVILCSDSSLLGRRSLGPRSQLAVSKEAPSEGLGFSYTVLHLKRATATASQPSLDSCGREVKLWLWLWPPTGWLGQ